ncbi:hypothetical protein PQZ07_00655 [bacterium]|nr:hypothetical protein [bacterium]
MTEKHEDLDDVVTDEIVEQTLEEMDGKAPAPKEDPDATTPEDEVAAVSKVVKDAPPQIKKVHPKTKAGMISAMTNKMLKMSKMDMQDMYASYHAESVDMEDSEVVVETTVDTSAELEALVESEATLSEEFKQKTAILFESALKSKLSEEVDRLEDQYKAELAEEVSSTKSDLVEKVDNYLNYVVETWMKDNKLAVQNGLRTEIAETFMEKMKDLFTESYIDVPESKVDLVDELAESVDELETKLNEQTQKVIDTTVELEGYKRNTIIREATRDLAETQVEKLKSLVEDVDFGSEEIFAEKVNTIKESYFSKTIKEEIQEEIAEEADQTVEVSDVMASYLSTIRKTALK